MTKAGVRGGGESGVAARAENVRRRVVGV